MSKLLIAVSVVLSLSASYVIADDVFRIQVPKEFKGKGSSNADLQRRVWELERAVAQLQMKVFQLQVEGTAAAQKEDWLCTVSARGTDYTGTGRSKAVASSRATESCRKANSGDGFFCNPPSCEQ